MKIANARAIFFLFALFIIKLLPAQEQAAEPYQSKAVILPFASYTPETRLMFGGVFVHQFKPGGAGPETRTSQNLFSGIYTLNRQLNIEFIPNVILRQEGWMLDGYYQYAFFPENYWGVGPDVSDEDELNVEYRRFDFRQKFLGRMAPGLYAGPGIRWAKLTNVAFTGENDEEVPVAGIDGASGSTLPGFGLSIRWDKRNSITFPTENHFLDRRRRPSV